jgi:tetrapyrrole methylase family protein/MazG family protein
VYAAIVERVLSLAKRPAGVVYGVPGHPLVGEATVRELMTQAQDEGVSVRIVAGLSFIEPVLTALEIDALSGLQLCDALDLAAHDHPPLNPDLPALVGQLYGRPLAADVKLTLMNQYPDDHPVALVHAAGTLDQRVARLPLYELDRQSDLAHLTTLYVPPCPGVGSFEGLQDTVAHLRAPEGCPWDREQTHQSLRSELLEETYEVLDAIEADDVAALREELGDLLLQILLHTQIAIEAGDFRMVEVINGIDAKLKHRHPHVWGERAVAGTQEVLRRWEELKREERGAERSILDGVPQALPALQQANTYGQRAARVGFDWNAVAGVVEKVREEIAELEAASTPAEQAAELGDLLFAVVNWARWLGVDPEIALRAANKRFRTRFQAVERRARERGVELAALSIEELEALWQAVKRDQRSFG